jgi:type I restriction enzyme S subunit
MVVKPGYKQTEIGIFPQDWDHESFGKLFTFSNGVNADKEAYGKGFRFVNVLEPITYSHLYGPEIPGRVCLPDSVGAAFAVKKGDVLFNRTSETDAELGLAATYLGTEHVVFGGFVIRGRPTDGRLDPIYSGYALRAPAIRSQIIPMGQGAIRANIGQQSLKLVIAPIPPPPEQHAIATALSDVDALLGALERLIAKKRDLKQAAMQKLLTGQTRLPGFHGEWEVKTLKQAVEISTGINKPISEMGSGTLYVTVQDLYDGTSIRTNILGRIKVSQTEIQAKALAAGDIVFGKSSVKREGIGYPNRFLGCGEPVVFSGFTYRARARQGIADATFVFYALRGEKTRRWLIDNSQASALTNINQTIADAIPIDLPPTLEQTAIAAVLSDMDAEIAALEARGAKARALKLAMMQDLLTGRVRLVPVGAAHA